MSISLPVAVRTSVSNTLIERIRERTARVCVLGLGYAGLPMAVEMARAGFSVTGVDISDERVRAVERGRSPVSDVADEDLRPLVETGRLRASGDAAVLGSSDCVLVCVPTPLTEAREPDLSFIRAAAASIASHLHAGQLVVLQSTCPAGTTRGVLLKALIRSTELRVGEDFFLAFASERIDPGNTRFTINNTPKVVGGVTPVCTEVASALFESIVDQIVRVSSPEVAEMSKLIENTFRFINISFINEMAVLCDRMGISVWEVVQAASTKPFAFMPHSPGPGIGGHCIPVVPFHLEATAHEHGLASQLITAAGRINDEMPEFVIEKLDRILAERGLALADARVLILGVAYKADVGDVRESPALAILEALAERAAAVDYHDPHVESAQCGARTFRNLDQAAVESGRFDCAVLLTAHSGVDYARVLSRVDVVLDARNWLKALALQSAATVIPL